MPEYMVEVEVSYLYLVEADSPAEAMQTIDDGEWEYAKMLDVLSGPTPLTVRERTPAASS